MHFRTLLFFILAPIHILAFYYNLKHPSLRSNYQNNFSPILFFIQLNHFPISTKYNFINITYSFDVKWHLYAIVSITSIIENSFNTSIWYNIYILTPLDFNNIAQKRLYTLTQKYNRLSIFIIPIAKKLHNFNPYKNAKSVAYRLFLPELLPNVHKIIHLDVDTYIFSDLDEMYSLDMTNLEFRGIIDFDFFKDLEKLNVTDNEHYINAGILLINLDELRKDHFMEKTVDFLSKYGKLIFLADQSIINIISYKKIDFLPLRFGFHNWFCSKGSYKKFFRSPVFFKYYKYNDVLNVINNLTIVHFMLKPWDKEDEPPYNRNWGIMALKTEYAHEISKTCPWINFLKNKSRIKRIFLTKYAKIKQYFLG